jgi:hypothetical protein
LNRDFYARKRLIINARFFAIFKRHRFFHHPANHCDFHQVFLKSLWLIADCRLPIADFRWSLVTSTPTGENARGAGGTP